MSGKGGGGHVPNVASDSLKSTAQIYVLNGLCEGPIYGWALAKEGDTDEQRKMAAKKCIKLNGTPIKNLDDNDPKDDNENFKGIGFEFRSGLPQQQPIEGFFAASGDVTAAALGGSVEVKHGGTPRANSGKIFGNALGGAIGNLYERIMAQLPLDPDANADGHFGARIFTISDTDADEISIRFAVNGLYEANDDGDVNGSAVIYTVEIKEQGGDWVKASDQPYIKLGKASQKYEWGLRLPLSLAGQNGGPWQVRVCKLTPDSNNQKWVCGLWIDGVSIIKNKKMTYPGVALCAIKADATQFGSIPQMSFHVKGMIIRVPKNYNPETREYSGTWDGTFKLAYSNNPAWCFYDILIENRYGLGDWVKPIYVDKWGLYEIGKYCDEMVPDGKGGTEPRFTLNCYISSQEEAARVVQAIASNFHAMTYWASGAVFAAQDAPRDPSYIFAPSNVKDGRFSYSSTARRARHNAMVAQWNDPENGYKLEPELVELPDMIKDLGFRFQSDRVAYGCTSRGQAQRDARWALYTANYQTEVVSFGTGLEGMQLRPGDIIAIADPLRDGGIASGRVKAVSGHSLTLDRSVDFPGGGAYSLIVTGEDGRVCETQITAPPGQMTSVNGSGLAYPAVENSLWTIASRDREPSLWRVLNVTPDGEGAFNISALMWNPRKFAWAEDGVDTYDRRHWAGIDDDSALRPPYGLILSEYLYKDKEDLKVGVTAQWASASGGGVFLPAYRIDGGNWVDKPPTNQCAVDISPVEAPCVLDFSVRARTVDGQLTPAAEASLNVLGKQAPPKDVTGFRVTCDNNANLVFTWTANDELDFSCYEIREGGANWEAASLLVTDLTANRFTTEIGNTRSTKFWIKAKDTSDNWSRNAASATLQIYSPLDGDVLSVEQKKLLAIQWAVTLKERDRLAALAQGLGVSVVALDNAIAAVNTFFSTRNTPYAWTDLTGPTNLGVGGGAQLNTLLATIADEMMKLQQALALAGTQQSIASGALDAILRTRFVDYATGAILWDKLDFASKIIFANQITIANFDNLIPNPNSALTPLPPSGTWEAAGLVSGNAKSGSYCRYASGPVYLTPEIPIPEGALNSAGLPMSFYFQAQAKTSGARIGMRFYNAAGSQVSDVQSPQATSSSYALLKCSSTAPSAAVSVRFYIQGGYFDELYAKQMMDGRLIVDGSIEASHILAGSIDATKIAAGQVFIGHTIQSSNYSTWNNSLATPASDGFKISSGSFNVALADKSSMSAQAEFGNNVSIGGRKAATLADYGTMFGVHITKFAMPLVDLKSSSNNVNTGTYGNAEKTFWPDPGGASMFSVTNSGVTVLAAGMYEIEAQCPFFFGFGEPAWSDSNRVDLLVNGVPVASTYLPMVIGRAGQNYAHSGVSTMGAGPVKAIRRLNAGDVVSMKGYACNAAYNRLANGAISSGITSTHAIYRDRASYMTIRSLLPISMAPSQSPPPIDPPVEQLPPSFVTPSGTGTDNPPLGSNSPGSGRGTILAQDPAVWEY